MYMLQQIAETYKQLSNNVINKDNVINKQKSNYSWE